MHVVRRGCLAALLVSLCLPACGTEASASCAGRFRVAAHLALAYCTNRALDARATGVRRLVIVVHGTQRNAADYERFMLAAARAAHVRDALVVAPRFRDWSSEGWKQGDGSRTSPRVSSFAALDALIAGIVRSHRFPGLRQIVV